MRNTYGMLAFRHAFAWLRLDMRDFAEERMGEFELLAGFPR